LPTKDDKESTSSSSQSLFKTGISSWNVFRRRKDLLFQPTSQVHPRRILLSSRDYFLNTFLIVSTFVHWDFNRQFSIQSNISFTEKKKLLFFGVILYKWSFSDLDFLWFFQIRSSRHERSHQSCQHFHRKSLYLSNLK
jgi:hypothetical protein